MTNGNSAALRAGNFLGCKAPEGLEGDWMCGISHAPRRGEEPWGGSESKPPKGWSF